MISIYHQKKKKKDKTKQNTRTNFDHKLGCSLKLQIQLKQIDTLIYFENLTVELHIIYVFNINVNIFANWMLFSIQSINLFFMYNFKLQKLKILNI